MCVLVRVCFVQTQVWLLVTLVIITFRLALNDANYDDPDDRADHCRRPHHCCDGAAPGYDCDDCYCCDGGGCEMFARVSVNASGVENCCVLSVLFLVDLINFEKNEN